MGAAYTKDGERTAKRRQKHKRRSRHTIYPDKANMGDFVTRDRHARQLRQCANKRAWLTRAVRYGLRITAGARYIGDGGHDKLIPQASHWWAV